MERLDKVLAAQGSWSRKDVAALIRRGGVRVDGIVVKDPSGKIDPDRATVEVGGRAVVLKRHVYIMLNKPTGVVSATRDSRESTVVDLVPPQLQRPGLFPAGRLDKDTVGFVLITDDGELAHNILSPKHHIPKTYLATLDVPVTDEMQAAFAEGIPLKDGRCLPAQLTRLGDCTAQVIICEGMYHQIKRMFGCCGAKVVTLKRTAMGALPLDPKLGEGQCREITSQELEMLCTALD